MGNVNEFFSFLEIQANPELYVSDEQDSCPSYAPKGTPQDPESQKPSSPAPTDKVHLTLGHLDLSS